MLLPVHSPRKWPSAKGGLDTLCMHADRCSFKLQLVGLQIEAPLEYSVIEFEGYARPRAVQIK